MPMTHTEYCARCGREKFQDIRIRYVCPVCCNREFTDPSELTADEFMQRIELETGMEFEAMIGESMTRELEARLKKAEEMRTDD